MELHKELLVTRPTMVTFSFLKMESHVAPHCLFLLTFPHLVHRMRYAWLLTNEIWRHRLVCDLLELSAYEVAQLRIL